MAAIIISSVRHELDATAINGLYQLYTGYTELKIPRLLQIIEAGWRTYEFVN